MLAILNTGKFHSQHRLEEQLEKQSGTFTGTLHWRKNLNCHPDKCKNPGCYCQVPFWKKIIVCISSAQGARTAWLCPWDRACFITEAQGQQTHKPILEQQSNSEFSMQAWAVACLTQGKSCSTKHDEGCCGQEPRIQYPYTVVPRGYKLCVGTRRRQHSSLKDDWSC